MVASLEGLHPVDVLSNPSPKGPQAPTSPAALRCSAINRCHRHRHEAVDLIRHIATTISPLHENDSDQVLGWVHPPIGPIGSSLHETADRIVAERAQRLAHNLESKSVS